MDVATIKNTFIRDGVVVIPNFYEPALISELFENFKTFKTSDQLRVQDVVHDDLTAAKERPLKYLQYVHFYIPSFCRLVTSRILALTSALFDQDTFFAQMEIHDKPQKGGTWTPFHQDNFYFCFDPPDACTVYVPLEKHSPENGGLCFIKGSHSGDTLTYQASKVKAFSSYLNINLEEYPEERLVKICLEPGGIAIHHCKTIHYAFENNSSKSRCSVSIRINGVKAKISPSLHERYLENLKYNRG